jgi:hypothetical protein
MNAYIAHGLWKGEFRSDDIADLFFRCPEVVISYLDQQKSNSGYLSLDIDPTDRKSGLIEDSFFHVQE